MSKNVEKLSDKQACDTAKAFITGIKIEMVMQGLKQKDLAKRMKVDQSFISKIFNGKQNLTIETIAKMAHAVGRTAIVGLTPKETP